MLVQIVDVEAIQDKINRKADEVTAVERARLALVNTSFPLETVSVLSEKRKLLGNLAKEHYERLRKTLADLHKFYNAHVKKVETRNNRIGRNTLPTTRFKDVL